MIIFHGDNILKSREAFINERQKHVLQGNQINELTGANLNLDQLKNSLNTSSLWGKNIVFIENFYSGRVSNEKKLISEYLKSQTDSEIYVWENKNVSVQIKSLPPKNSLIFDLPKYIFQFLDTFSPDLLEKTLNDAAPEQVFALLITRMHQLIIIKSKATNAIPPWLQSKLMAQAARYPLDRLVAGYGDLLKIDYAQKTSNSALPLHDSLALWLLKL